MDALSLLGGLAVVTAGAELLVRGSSTLALRLGLSPLFVGLAIVGAGTSSPELFASLMASLRGSPDVAVGNVVGSNSFNIGVILGATALVQPIRIQLREVRRDLWIGIGACLVPFLAPVFGGTLPRWLGGVAVGSLLAYLALALRAARSAAPAELTAVDVQQGLGLPARRGWIDSAPALGGMVLLGLAALWFGSSLFVESAVALLSAWGVSELVIGVTVVSAGTSLPELVTSIVAARRGQTDLALGNVLGSGIFNLLGILGVCALVAPQQVDRGVLVLHAPVMLVFTVALLPIVRSGGQVSRREGALLLVAYAGYLAWMFV